MTGEEITVATHEHVIEATKPRPALGLLSGTSRSGSRFASWPASRSATGSQRRFWRSARRGRQGQSAGRWADLADDHSDVAQDRCRRTRSGARTLARRRGDAFHQLGGGAVLDGAAGLVVHRPSVPPMAAGGPDQRYVAGLILLAAAPCTAMVFVWSNLCRWRAALHACPRSRFNDATHGGRLRAHCGPLARPLPRSSVPWETLVISVVFVHRHPGDRGRRLVGGLALLRRGENALDAQAFWEDVRAARFP